MMADEVARSPSDQEPNPLFTEFEAQSAVFDHLHTIAEIGVIPSPCVAAATQVTQHTSVLTRHRRSNTIFSASGTSPPMNYYESIGVDYSEIMEEIARDYRDREIRLRAQSDHDLYVENLKLAELFEDSRAATPLPSSEPADTRHTPAQPDGAIPCLPPLPPVVRPDPIPSPGLKGLATARQIRWWKLGCARQLDVPAAELDFGPYGVGLSEPSSPSNPSDESLAHANSWPAPRALEIALEQEDELSIGVPTVKRPWDLKRARSIFEHNVSFHSDDSDTPLSPRDGLNFGSSSSADPTTSTATRPDAVTFEESNTDPLTVLALLESPDASQIDWSTTDLTNVLECPKCEFPLRFGGDALRRRHMTTCFFTKGRKRRVPPAVALATQLATNPPSPPLGPIITSLFSKSLRHTALSAATNDPSLPPSPTNNDFSD
jgi:hypothetical protein